MRIKPLMTRLAEYCEAGAVGASEGLTAAASDIAEPDNATAAYTARAMPAVAMTDLYNMFAMVKFYRQALANGIKPLIGVDARVQNSALAMPPSRVILLAQNDEGYGNLTKLVSMAYQQGQAGDEPCIEREWLFERADGLIALSGGQAGEPGMVASHGRSEEALALCAEWQQVFGDRYYLELHRTLREGEEQWIDTACELATKLDVALVATNDVCFLDKSEFQVHETRLCIQKGFVLADGSRPKTHSEEQYLKTPEQMLELFSDIPEALQNSVEIAKRCSLEISLGQPVLPDFPIPDGMTEAEFFTQEAEQGLNVRLQSILAEPAAHGSNAALEAATTTPGNSPVSELIVSDKRRDAYDQRLQRELSVIIEMDFPGYFLIVADFIRWARENDVPVGPGRGSGAGSLVAFALGITDLDPLQYDLLFERFLNPERVSMPDFDIDFCMDGRDRVIQYVSDTYGEHRVSQIITYGTMAAKAVVRDVGRVMGHPYGFVDRIAKMVPFEVGMTLKRALDESEDLASAYRDDEEVTSLLDMGLALEGLARNAGKHAGGVVIAPTALTDFTPLYCEPDGSSLVTQFDKDDAEAVGLVKFDFLGLRTLTIIENAVRFVNQGMAGSAEHNSANLLDLSQVPLDDAPTYQLLQKAQTTAVFQLESPGMKRLIERLRPDNFEDIIALVALYRPGPLQSGMVDDFIDRKHGRKALAWPHEDYQLESLKPVLEPTYGVILYQEQVIQIAQVMAGFSLGRSDLLRRAMGKKKAEEMALQREGFLAGCVENEIDAELSGNIFDLVEKFAGYGFNKSHSAAYALLSYQTAWLKCHHPAAFMCAVLSADMDNTDKVVGLIEECVSMGLTVQSPDINASIVRFDVVDRSNIRYGLGAIKGVGEAALRDVLLEREKNGTFRDLESLCRRLDSGSINKRVLEALIRAGAADGLGHNRASMMANLPAALQAAEQFHRDQDAGQDDLFGLVETVAEETTVPLQELPEWPEKQLLANEKESLGLYLSGHPITEHLPELANFTSGRIADLCARATTAHARNNGGQQWRQKGIAVLAAGLIIGVRTRDVQGSKMGFVTLDDRGGRTDVVMGAELLETSQHFLLREEVLIVDGEISVDEFNGGFRIRARDVYDLAAARARFARRLVIDLGQNAVLPATLEQMLETLAASKRGNTPVCFDYSNGLAKARIQAGKTWLINPEHALLESLNQLAGEDSVELVY